MGQQLFVVAVCVHRVFAIKRMLEKEISEKREIEKESITTGGMNETNSFGRSIQIATVNLLQLYLGAYSYLSLIKLHAHVRATEMHVFPRLKRQQKQQRRRHCQESRISFENRIFNT